MNNKTLRYDQSCLFNDPAIIDQMIPNIGKKPNKVQRLHMSSILANMLRSQITELPVRHATRTEYKWVKRYNPCGLRRRGINKTLKLMVAFGFVTQHRGFKYGSTHRVSSFEPTDKLLEILGGLDDWTKIKRSTDDETLVLKVKGIKAGYEDTPFTNKMRGVLCSYNDMLSQHDVDHPTYKPFRISRLILKRNFVEFDQRLGGRFYGPWQNIPSKERGKLTIDGEPTVEHDFKSLYPAMLWGKQGINVFDILEDPYAIETEIHPDGDIQRKVVKKLFMAMLGSKCCRDAINSTKKAFREKFYLDYYVLNEAVMEIKKKHMPIAHHFFKGKNFMLELQFMDSLICESILEMMMGRGVLVLPVHDSFIVQEEHEGQLLEVMRQAFRNHCGGFEPVIEKKGPKPLVIVESQREVSVGDVLDEILGDLLGPAA